MPTYYMLLTDDNINVGDVVPNVGSDGQPNAVVIDPRTMPITDALDGRARDGLVDIMRGNEPSVRVVQVEPEGTVRPHSHLWDPDDNVTDDIELEADGGWRVVAIAPLHTILGPQGQLILTLAERGAVVFEDEDRESDAANIYHREIEQLHDSPGGDAAWDSARLAASKALSAVGADTYWWENSISCVWGTEILALGARDLIGHSSEWTQDAYDLLTRPWRTAFPGTLS